jgi:hypothetical protein
MKLALNGVMHILTDLLVGNVNPGFKANQTEIKKLLRMYQFILNLPISVVVSCSKLKIKKKKQTGFSICYCKLIEILCPGCGNKCSDV